MLRNHALSYQNITKIITKTPRYFKFTYCVCALCVCVWWWGQGTRVSWCMCGDQQTTLWKQFNCPSCVGSRDQAQVPKLAQQPLSSPGISPDLVVLLSSGFYELHSWQSKGCRLDMPVIFL